MKKRLYVFLHLLTVLSVLGLTGCSRTVEDVAKWKTTGNIEKLIKALTDPKIEVRLDAAAALGELKAGQAVDSLAALYNDPEADVIVAAVEALAEIGSPATVTPLTAALKLDDPESRLRAAVKLGELKANGAVAQLAEALKDSEADVQLAAAAALGLIADEAGSAGLASMLNDPSSKLRKTCAESLGKTGGEAAVNGLIPALADADSGVSTAARNALTEIGEPAVPFLLRALKDEQPPVRAGSIFVLRKLDAVPESGADLIWYQLARVSIDSQTGIDQGIVQNLLKMDAASVDTLLEAAALPVEDFREHAAYVLERIGEDVLEKAVAAADAHASPSGKAWFAGRGSWPGAPSWRIDLWAALAALDPTFSLNRAAMSSLEMQARPAFNVLTDQNFTLTRAYIPALIALLGDTTKPPPEQPDYDAEGMPVIKQNRDMFRGEANRQLAGEKLKAAGYKAALPLIAAIEGRDELAAGNAADILGYMGDKRALQPLMHVVRTKLDSGEQLTDSPFYIALQKMDEPEAEPLLLKIRPNADRAMRVFARKYTELRPISAETKDQSEQPEQELSFRIGYIDRGRIAEQLVTFQMNEEGHWVPNPPLPEQPESM